jgi:raffinose/stachyose/melibiose transport system permease protein
LEKHYTLIVLTITSIINPFIAYKISINWDKKIYRFLYIAISSAMLIPSKVILFPLIKIYYNLGLMNTFGLIIYYTIFMIPEMVFLYVPYFRMFSKDLKNAAIIDGSTEFTFYKDVFLPICKPIIITGAILITIWTWNDFFMPLMILNKNPDSWTLPIFIYNFMGKFSAHKNYAFAACVISLIPISIFYILFHKKILSGFKIKNNKRVK